MFDKLFEKVYGVIISEEHLIDAVRAFNTLGITRYRFVEISTGCNGGWFVEFTANKIKYYKFLCKVKTIMVTRGE